MPRLTRGTNTSVCVLAGNDSHFVMCILRLLVHRQVTIIFVVSVCLCVCLFVPLVCAEFFSAVFDPISIKLGHMLHVQV